MTSHVKSWAVNPVVAIAMVFILGITMTLFLIVRFSHNLNDTMSNQITVRHTDPDHPRVDEHKEAFDSAFEETLLVSEIHALKQSLMVDSSLILLLTVGLTFFLFVIFIKMQRRNDAIAEQRFKEEQQNSRDLYGLIEEREEAYRELKQQIQERQEAENALKRRTEELESFNKMMVGRELKMIELKQEIEVLKKKRQGES